MRRACCIGGVLLFFACARPPPAPVVAPPPLDPTPKPVAPPPTPAPPAAKPDPCPTLPPGAVSSDEAPIISGVGKDAFYPEDWLAARGVTAPAATEWYASRFHVADRDLARTLFFGSSCRTATVGDPPEEAIACESDISNLLMHRHALVLVVRKKRLALVLDVGLGIKALDWPDRPLDLSLVLEPGGMGARLGDRAPDGTHLLPAPSSCREYYAMVDRCEQALAKKEKPEERCNVIIAADGTQHAERLDWAAVIGAGSSDDDDPVTLHDCEHARPSMRRAVADAAKLGGVQAKDTREAAAFVERSCNDRGHWVWKDGRFVKDRNAP